MDRRTFVIGAAAVAVSAKADDPLFDPDRWLRERKLSRLATVTPQSGKPFQPIQARTLDEWKTERALYEKAYRELVGNWPAKRPSLDSRVLEEKKFGNFTRFKVAFSSLPSKSKHASEIRAWLFVPHDAKGKLPAIVTVHQTVPQGKDEPAGIKASLPWLTHATYYAQRGYVTLAPDLIGFGERTSGGYERTGFEYADAAPILDTHREMTLLGFMLYDVSRCFDYLETRAEVDVKRIGVLGHSLGGIVANCVMGLEPRFRIGVSSCGYGLFRHDEQFPERWAAKNSAYLPRLHLYRKEADALPVDFHHILALAAPRAMLIQTARGDTIWTKPAVARAGEVADELKRVWKLYGKEEEFCSVLVADGATDRDHGWYPEGHKAADELLKKTLQ